MQPLSASLATEREGVFLEWIDQHIKLIEDHSEVLRKSVYSYLSCCDQDILLGEWAYLYHHVLKQNGNKYDVFFVYVGEDVEGKFIFIKENQVFLWIPYMKVPDSPKKWTFAEWNSEICLLEQDLVMRAESQDADPDVILEIGRKLKKLKDASLEMEEYFNPIRSEIVASIRKVMNQFWKLQVSVKGFNTFDFYTLSDYLHFMGPSHEFFFYGMNTNIFGASIVGLTGSGTPSSEIQYLMRRLASYAMNPVVKKDVPTILFDAEDVDENPFIKKYW